MKILIKSVILTAWCIFILFIISFAEEQKIPTSQETEKTAGYFLNLGKDSYFAAKYEDALEAYRKAIEINPNLAEAHCDLGSTYIELGKYQKAIDAFKRAIQIKPDYEEAYFNLDSVYGDIRKFREMVKSLEFASEKDHRGAKLLLAYVLSTCPDAGICDGKRTISII